MNKFMILGGVGVLGLVWYMHQKSLAPAVVTNAIQNTSQTNSSTQGANMYPYTNPAVVRNDNLTQPWYNGGSAAVSAAVPIASNALLQATGSSNLPQATTNAFAALSNYFSPQTEPDPTTDDTSMNAGTGDNVNVDDVNV